MLVQNDQIEMVCMLSYSLAHGERCDQVLDSDIELKDVFSFVAIFFG